MIPKGIKVTTKSLEDKKLIQEYSKDFSKTLNDIDTQNSFGGNYLSRWHNTKKPDRRQNRYDIGF